MRPNRVYLLYPGPHSIPDIAEWIAEVLELLRADAAWDDWDLHATQYNDKNSFDVQPLYVRVLNKPGPVLLVEGVQGKPLADIREKLGIHAIVLVHTVADPTELWVAVEEARRRHEAGEPLLARKLLVAVLIVRKLLHRHYWGGNAKGYLWHFDLAKGRGVDERFADVAEEVANDLLLHGILINKTSQGKQKYALNPDRKAEVHAIADSGTFQNKHLKHVLMRDRRQESASYLYQPHTAQGFTLRAGDATHQCVSVGEIIARAKNCADCMRYEAKVHFENGRVLRETFEEKRVLLQFFEVFL
jgi:hypothetical protein